jgi:hypothetical protein
MPASNEDSLREQMLHEPIDRLRVLLASEPPTTDAKRAAITAMRALVLEHPFKPNGLRFELLLMFLLEDGRLAAEHACTILSVISDDSEWLYEGIMIAAHAEGLVGEPWLREHYPALSLELQTAARVVLAQVNAPLGTALAILG